MEANKENVSIVVVPFPAQGHLNQLLHLSIVLSSHGLTVYYAALATHIHQAISRLEGWHASTIDLIRFHELPIPPFASPAPNPNSSLFFPSHLEPLFKAFEDVRPHLANLLRSLSISSRRVVVISDNVISFAASEAAALPNCEPYTFRCVPPSVSLPREGQDSPAGALLRSLGLKAPSTDDWISEEMLAFFRSRSESKPEYSGMLINTCRLIEGEFLDFFMKQQPDFIGKKVFAIGPVNPTVITDQTTKPRHHCLDWLDKQPPASVLYVSFGSNTSISDDQIQQLAIGLLNSEQKFIWVLREADRGDAFTELRENGRQNKLPAGFMGRIHGKGIVIGDWAPQLEILSHKSIACFMSHCGWNSCMESISMGVPMLTWPMHSDQPWNSVLVSDYLKVGVIVRDWKRRKEVLFAVEIEKVIKEVMVGDKGEEIKRRARELREAVRQAVADGGSSHTELISFINHITR
ncbi:putative cis-zeatin O-glucosyltransferase [Carex littledalei]|uniref:Glycosyltransferase n=1 Tax=Carex littledalei TaxID=544730 RepID=A0A833R8I6_9POAL|nr:putative cis-zeatin O-glucosyltransferase [Carex littledalei]